VVIWPLPCHCQSCWSLASGSIVWGGPHTTFGARRRPNLWSLAGCLRPNFIFETPMVIPLSSSHCLMPHLRQTSSVRSRRGKGRVRFVEVVAESDRAKIETFLAWRSLISPMCGLIEFPNVSQIPGEPRRRWFTSENLGLVVWCDESDRPM